MGIHSGIAAVSRKVNIHILQFRDLLQYDRAALHPLEADG